MMSTIQAMASHAPAPSALRLGDPGDLGARFDRETLERPLVDGCVVLVVVGREGLDAGLADLSRRRSRRPGQAMARAWRILGSRTV